MKVLFLVFLHFFFAKGFPEESANSSRRIVLGGEIDIKRVPWQVSFYRTKPPNLIAFFCGGAIIGRYQVLTAGHCISHQKIENLLIRAGSSSRTEGGTFHQIEMAEVHPNFLCTSSKFQHDLAFVRVKQPFQFSETTKPIKLGFRNPWNGEVVQIAGWGKTMPHYVVPQTDLPATLRFTKLRAWDINECYRYFKNEAIAALESDMYCVNNYKLGTYEAICQGDSGSPVTLNGRLLGVVSSGVGKDVGVPQPPPNTPCHLVDPGIQNQMLQKFVCNDPETTGLFNSIVHHKRWIKQMMRRRG